MKKCPKCGSEMPERREPKVSNLANVDNKSPSKVKYWLCSNKNCGFIEKA